MSGTSRLPDAVAPLCPECRGSLTLVGSWVVAGLWGYNEVHTYECPAHGPVFIKPELTVNHRQQGSAGNGPDHGDRDLLIPAAAKPVPTLNIGAIGIPEPESD